MWYLPHPPIAYARVKVGYLLSRMKAYLNGSKFRIGISDDLMGIFGPFKWVPIKIAKKPLTHAAAACDMHQGAFEGPPRINNQCKGSANKI